MSSVINDSKISLRECWRHLIAAIQFAIGFGDFRLRKVELFD